MKEPVLVETKSQIIALNIKTKGDTETLDTSSGTYCEN